MSTNEDELKALFQAIQSKLSKGERIRIEIALGSDAGTSTAKPAPTGSRDPFTPEGDFSLIGVLQRRFDDG